MKLITTEEQLCSHIPNIISSVKGETPLLEKLSLFLELAEDWVINTFTSTSTFNTICGNNKVAAQYQDIVLPPCYCRSSAPCNSFARHRAYAQRLRDCQHQQHNPGIETTNRQAHRLYAISPRRLHRRSVARTCRGKPMAQISSVGFLRSDTFPGPRHCRCTRWSHRLPLGKVSRTPLTGH